MRELWAELSSTMRLVRQNAGMSLRQAELASGRGRGVLSQVETQKARPNRDLVEWYDTTFDGDGLLVSLYVEARTAGPASTPAWTKVRPHALDGDAMAVDAALVAAGELVATGADVVAGWTLHNCGTVRWQQRSLRRVGAPAGTSLLRSAIRTPVPDCRPGELADVRLTLGAPDRPGTVAAYWEVTDDCGRPLYDRAHLLSVVVVVRP